MIRACTQPTEKTPSKFDNVNKHKEEKSEFKKSIKKLLGQTCKLYSKVNKIEPKQNNIEYSLKSNLNSILDDKTPVDSEQIIDGLACFSVKIINLEWEKMKTAWYQNNISHNPVFKKGLKNKENIIQNQYQSYTSAHNMNMNKNFTQPVNINQNPNLINNKNNKIGEVDNLRNLNITANLIGKNMRGNLDPRFLQNTQIPKVNYSNIQDQNQTMAANFHNSHLDIKISKEKDVLMNLSDNN